jgi:hypothetical protein
VAALATSVFRPGTSPQNGMAQAFPQIFNDENADNLYYVEAEGRPVAMAAHSGEKSYRLWWRGRLDDEGRTLPRCVWCLQQEFDNHLLMSGVPNIPAIVALNI